MTKGGTDGCDQSRCPFQHTWERRPKSPQFYTDVVGCKHLPTTPNEQMVFLDAAGTCLILVKRDPPMNPVLHDHGGVQHSFAVAHDDYVAALDHLRAHGDEITFEEDRQGGVLNGPRAYFHDPDGQATPAARRNQRFAYRGPRTLPHRRRGPTGLF